MRVSLKVMVLACAMLVCVSATPYARSRTQAGSAGPHGLETAASRTDTLWIFDADFEDLAGDNAGWTTSDESGTPEYINYWHKDTIRINGFTHLGDSTWWCGTYNSCWAQPRGYGNNWICYLSRSIPGVAVLTSPGDELLLHWDQRVAMEQNYDYGYVDVSGDSGATWSTIAMFDNPGFARDAGTSQDWDSIHPDCAGHQTHDVSDYAGTDFALRLRMESDGAYSSQDMYNNPPRNTCLDGAWQIDNIHLQRVSPGSLTLFFDDCEAPGDNGWVHDSLPAWGQTGVVFERRFESFDGHAGWMMAAYDADSGTMVDGQLSHLFSPPIDVSGAPALVGCWEGWVDLPGAGDDGTYIHLNRHADPGCLWQRGYYGASEWWLASAGPEWGVYQDDWSAWTGSDWFGIKLTVWDSDPAPNPHGKGFVLNRMRVGIPLATSIPESQDVRVELLSARPNPFNPLTSVTYMVSRRGRAVLRVYDLAGRRVRTLVDRNHEPGEHETMWDGTDDSGERVASGVYMLRLEVEGGASVSVKAVLLK